MAPRPENQPREVPTSTLPRGPRLCVCEDREPPEGPPGQARPTPGGWGATKPAEQCFSLEAILPLGDMCPCPQGNILGCHKGEGGGTQWVEAKNTATSHDALDSP